MNNHERHALSCALSRHKELLGKAESSLRVEQAIATDVERLANILKGHPMHQRVVDLVAIHSGLYLAPAQKLVKKHGLEIDALHTTLNEEE